jgi:hypothetical protein
MSKKCLMRGVEGMINRSIGVFEKYKTEDLVSYYKEYLRLRTDEVDLNKVVFRLAVREVLKNRGFNVMTLD